MAFKDGQQETTTAGAVDTGVLSDNSQDIGDFDMESALADMSDGLGFKQEEVQTEVKPSAEAAPAATAAVVDPSAPTLDPASQAAAETAQPKTAPRTWRPEAAAIWSTIPEAAQAEILKREEDIFQGIEQYKADATFGKPVYEVMRPYLPILEQHGINPAQQVGDLMRANYVLAFGTPEQKTQMLVTIARDYQIPLDGLPSDAVQDDPAVIALREQVNELKSTLTTQQQEQMKARAVEIDRIVQAFAADPKNLYFKELEGDIERLIRAKEASTLEEAYEKAIWLNPAVRAKELARQQAEQQKSEEQAKAERLAAAKKATGANVKTAAQGGRATAPLGTMDDTLNETLAEIKNRAK